MRVVHRRQREHLQEVVLEDVAQRSRLLVERPAVLDAEVLRHGDLHMVDVPAIPNRLEDRVGEPQGEDVLDRLLRQVVVDAVDLVLAEVEVELGVELTRALQVAAEGLLDDDPAWPSDSSASPARPTPAATFANICGIVAK
jgi:hypothetical protein